MIPEPEKQHERHKNACPVCEKNERADSQQDRSKHNNPSERLPSSSVMTPESEKKSVVVVDSEKRLSNPRVVVVGPDEKQANAVSPDSEKQDRSQHSPATEADKTPPIPRVLSGNGSKPWFAVTFSQKTENLPLVKRLIPHLQNLGIEKERIFLQDNISDVDQESHWLSQWMGAQRSSKVAVCMLNSAYLLSRPCCTEWKLIQEWQRLVICTEDVDDMMLAVDVNGFNGPPLAHLQAEEQTLSVLKYTEEQLALKIFEKYQSNLSRSYEDDLKTRHARRVSMTISTTSPATSPSISPSVSPTVISPSVHNRLAVSSSSVSIMSTAPTMSVCSSSSSSGLSGTAPPTPVLASCCTPATNLMPVPSPTARHIIIKPAKSSPPFHSSVPPNLPAPLPSKPMNPPQSMSLPPVLPSSARQPMRPTASQNGPAKTPPKRGSSELVTITTSPPAPSLSISLSGPPPRPPSDQDNGDLVPSLKGFALPPPTLSASASHSPSSEHPRSTHRAHSAPARRQSFEGEDLTDDTDAEDGAMVPLSPFVSRMSTSSFRSHSPTRFGLE